MIIPLKRLLFSILSELRLWITKFFCKNHHDLVRFGSGETTIFNPVVSQFVLYSTNLFRSSSNANGFGAVHRMDEEKTRQDIEDIINSIHEPSLDVLDHSFASYADQPSPTTPRNRFQSPTSSFSLVDLLFVTKLLIVSMCVCLCVF